MKPIRFACTTALAQLLAASSLALPQTTLLVDPAAAPGGSGGSWPTAMASLQVALDEASANSSAANEYTILLREGTHRPPVQPLSGNRSFVIQNTRSVRIVGGFLNSTAPDQPDGVARRCILDGAAYVDGTGTAFDAAVHVVDLPGLDAEPGDEIRIERMTIQGGRARGDNTALARDFGGAGLIAEADNIRLELTDILFIDNEAGDTGVQNNSEGGALILENTSQVGEYLVRRCFFVGNSAQRGGAVYVRGGPRYSFGDCTFVSNGKVNRLPQAMGQTFDAESHVTRSGGAVALDNDAVTEFSNCLVYDNRAADFGGAVAWTPNPSPDAQPLTQQFTHCTIVRNWVLGDRVRIIGPGGSTVGFVDQDARAAGIHVTPTSIADAPREIAINNSILWNQGYGPDIVIEGDAGAMTPLEGAVCLIQFSDYEEFQDASTFAGGGVDPVALMTSISAFPDWTSGPGAFRLSAGSPCVDSASDALVGDDIVDIDDDNDYGEILPFDLAGNPREVPLDSPDMGAFERQ